MNTMKKSLQMVIVFAGLFSSVVLCGQTAQPEYDLQFEVSQNTVPSSAVPYAPSPRGKVKPTHMAVLYTKGYPPHLSNDQTFRKSLEGDVSAEQARFMDTVISARFIIHGHSSDTGYRSVTFYGVSEKDVRIMTKSYIKWANKQAEAGVEKIKSDLINSRKQKSETEKLIVKQREDTEEIEAKLLEMKKNVLYRNSEDANETLQAFIQVLHLIGIEIVGIEAKLGVIKQHHEKLENQGSNYPKGTYDLLFQMRLTQEIELSGALARKKAAQSAHKNALDFSDLSEQAMTLQQKIEFNQKQLIETQTIIDRLNDPHSSLRPVELANSKVVIYQVSNR